MSYYTFMPKLLNMSMTASVAIVLVILLRLLLRKAPKVISYALWGVVLFRLLCPVSISSDFSVYNLFDAPTEGSGTVTSVIEYIPSDIVHTKYPAVTLPVPGISDAINETLPQGEEQLRADPLEGPLFIAAYLWLTGVAVMVCYSMVSFAKLRRKLLVVAPLRDNIFIADDIKSPFVVGLLRPKIYLPCNLEAKEQAYIILHEQHHIKRFDHIIKALAFLVLTVHWFNPLVWVAFILAGKDMEMSCDEAVVQQLGSNVRADYSASLLTLATGRRIIAGTPLAFGEGDTKGRIHNLSKWKKPAMWTVALATVACIVLAISLLTNPKQDSYTLRIVVPAGSQKPFVYADEEISPLGDHIIITSGDGLGDTEVMLKTVQVKAEISFIPTYLTPGLPVKLELEKGAWFKIGVNMQNNTDEDQIVYVNVENVEVRIPNNATDSPQASISAISSVIEWFDYLDDYSSRITGVTAELPEYPGVVFEFTQNEITASKAFGASGSTNPVTLISGMPIWNAYFTDLTGDGLPELCSTISLGSGDIHNIVFVYDYAKGKAYDMAERGKYDFTIRFNEEDGCLYVDKQVHPWGELVTSGRLAFKDNCIQILEETTSSSVVIDIVDPTEDKNFFYDTATEKFFEDEVYDYFFGGIYSQHVIVHYADGTTEDIVTALNSGKASIADLDRFGIPYWAEPKVDPLNAAIRSAIIEVNRHPKDPDGLYHCASFVLLQQVELSFDSDPPRPNEVTVYGIALHQSFSFSGGALLDAGGSHIPVAITFDILNGEYSLKEYWRPGDGSYYVSDIRDKFPDEIEEEALDTQKYIRAQIQDCYAQAVEFGGVDTTTAIEELFTIIESSPLHSSNPGDYINEHSIEYRELTYYGQYTLRYCFEQFLKGGQTGLRGHLMKAVIDDLAPESKLQIQTMTGQEYFDEWKAAAIRVSEQHSMEWIKGNQPAVWILIQMMGEYVIELDKVSALVSEKGYTGEDFKEELLGQFNKNIIHSWGKPDFDISGFGSQLGHPGWAQIWYLDEENHQRITLYLNEKGYVEDILIDTTENN